MILREAVDADGDFYDVILIDCPPSLGILTINALVAAHELIIPLQAQFFALQGLSKLLDTVTLVRRRINPGLRVDGIALCMHESTTRLAGEVVDDLMLFLNAARGTGVPWADAYIYNTCIRRNIKLAEASSFGQTIFDYAPRSNGAADYARLAAEVFADLGGIGGVNRWHRKTGKARRYGARTRRTRTDDARSTGTCNEARRVERLSVVCTRSSGERAATRHRDGVGVTLPAG